MGDVKLKITMDTRDQTDRHHPLLSTNVTGDQRFCAYSHCSGACGFPALFLRIYPDMTSPLEQEAAEASRAQKDEQGRVYYDYKAHGSMVACGPVWQRKRWSGERIYLPEPHASAPKMLDMYWW